MTWPLVPTVAIDVRTAERLVVEVKDLRRRLVEMHRLIERVVDVLEGLDEELPPPRAGSVVAVRAECALTAAGMLPQVERCWALGGAT